MGSGARALWAFLVASAAVMLTVGLIAAFGTNLWQADGVSVCVADGFQEYPKIVSDGSGGAIVAWADNRQWTGNDIYARRVYSDGTAAWATDGVSLCVASNGQYLPQISSDGSGGAIVTWQDRRSGSGNDDIYARRVYSDGTAAWVADGVSLCVAADYQSDPQIATDGSGGAIVTWEDERDDSTTDPDIYARRVDANGNALWITDGVSICVAANVQKDPQIASDGSGGAIVAWYDHRGSNGDIYAQRVDANGNTLWYTDGVTICDASGLQSDPQIVSDGSGGAIVTWEDLRSGITYDIYAQRVYSDGTVAWTTGGVSLTVAGSGQYDPQIASDGSGGAIVTWADGREYITTGRDIYAQRVDASGNVLWQADGVSLCVASSDQSGLQIASDGSGGAIVTWHDERDYGTTGYDIYAQRVDTNGSVKWQADGVRACGAIDDQIEPYLVYDGAEGAIVTWWDRRGNDYDIYVQRVSDLVPTDFVRLPLVAKNY